MEQDSGFSVKGFLWSAMLLVLVPNFLFFLVAFQLDLGRPIFNVDYAFSAIFIMLRVRLVAAALMLVAFFFDALALVGQIFPVLHFSGMLYVSRFVGMAPLFYQLMIFIGLGFAVMNAFMVFRLPERSSKESLAIVINIAVFAYVIQVFWGGERDDRIWRVADGVLVDSQTVFAFDTRGGGFVKSLKAEGKVFADVKSPGATSTWFSQPVDLNDRIFLIVSESWGSTKKTIIDALLRPLTDQGDRVSNLTVGEINFEGLTIAAEMRELCQLHPVHFNFSESDDVLADCLPNKLKKNGYSTFAMHGAAGLMYDRVKWYPKVGFDHLTFFESNSWERRCYSFPGACDSELMGRLEDVFTREGKVFSYWLTLNSHSRYDERDIEIDKFNCDKYGVPEGSQTCRNLKLHAQFFYNLAGIIDKPYMDGVEVIVVGDHEPPILNKKEKDQYFERGVVPWLRFNVSNGQGVIAQGGR